MDAKVTTGWGGIRVSDREWNVPLGSAPSAPLATLTYRSRLRADVNPDVLAGLVDDARLRNHDTGVTGALLHDRGQVLQWLEGPERAIAPLWEAIARDRRHGAVELLTRGSAIGRVFGHWNMGLITRGVIPEATPEEIAQQIATVASLCVANDSETIVRLLTPGLMAARAGSSYAALLSGAAREVGDAWQDDQVTGIEVTVALGCLQRAARQLVAISLSAPLITERARTILIAPPPGEPHILGTALATDVFWAAGWQVEVAYPTTRLALRMLVSGAWFDAVDLCLSDAHPRADALDQLAAVTDMIREASLNPAIVVLVGGRAVLDSGCTAERVGADGCYHDVDSALGLARACMSPLRQGVERESQLTSIGAR